jgi:formylglycine-generating enzyme required for sulfatase activity
MLRLLLSVSLLAACNGVSAPPPPPAAKAEPAPMPRSKVLRPAASTAPSAPPPAPPAIPDDMLPVPGGKFVMGADDEGERDEQPAHEVELAGFLLDKTEVTNAAYRDCVASKVCRPYRDDVAKAMKYGAESKFRGPSQPVVGVSWDDARTYCAWRGKRLPTEAEFERASRGSDGRKYVWGNEPPDPKRHGVFAGSVTEAVGSRPDGAGPHGHLDLAGNVWEWVADYYDPYAYRRPTAHRGIPGSCEQILKTQDELRESGQQGFTGTNPIPKECERVLRGGAFNYPVKGLRASNRVHHPGTWRLLVAGFRCAMNFGD